MLLTRQRGIVYGRKDELKRVCMQDSKEFKPKRRERRAFSNEQGGDRRSEFKSKWQGRKPSEPEGEARRPAFKKKWEERRPAAQSQSEDRRPPFKKKWEERKSAERNQGEERRPAFKKKWEERRPMAQQGQGEERRNNFKNKRPDRRPDSAKPAGNDQHRIHFPKQNEPVELGYVAQKRVASIKNKLYEIRQYKRLLEEQGLKPDQDDKVRESELIVQLLRLEKGLAPKAKPKKLRDGTIPEGRRPEKAKRKLRRW